MQKNYEYRFQVKPGRYVYLPTDEARLVGNKIRAEVLKRWQPNSIFYHLLRCGGHVVALRRHMTQQYFGKRDVEHFFSCVTRTKVARALRSIGFDAKSAFDIAVESVVDSEIGKHVPYGFVQSPVLATLALEKSALGSFLINRTPEQVTVTVYVDDISFSSDNAADVTDYGNQLDEMGDKAGFQFSPDKTVICKGSIEIFNCIVENQGLEVLPQRLEKFVDQLKVASDRGREAIIRYVNEINEDQAEELATSIET